MEAIDQQFVKEWKEKRLHKWRYIIKVGVLGWGLPVGLIAYFLMIIVGTKEFELPGLIIQVLVFGGGGVVYGHFQFRASDKRYFKLIKSAGQ